MNPSFTPHGKFHIGIPLLSGISYSYTNSGFRYSDLFKTNASNNLILDMGNAIKELKSRNYISLHAETEILAFGIKSGRNYFSLNVTEKADINFLFSKSLIEFIYDGNAATIGILQQLNPQLESIHYREYGFSWAREISDYLSGGIRVKYLYGMEHVVTKGSGVNIYTDPSDFTITATTDYSIYTSGVDSNSFNNINIGDYAFGKQNSGYAMDAGVTIKPVKSIEISASVIDLGRINWQTNNTIHTTTTHDGNFVYSGINLDEFINNDSLDAETYIQAIGDSLYESFNLTTSQENYTSKMPLQYYISTSYLITQRFKLTALFRNKVTYHGNHSDYHLSITGKSKSWLNYSVSLNKLNETPLTLGAGACINFRNNQIYFISDNLPGMISWKNSYSTGFRAGINIMLGTRTKNKTAPQPKLEEAVSLN